MSARSFLAHDVPHLPGTHFKYNTAATFMQSAIVQKQTGETVLDYLRPRLFGPLDIEDPVWDTNFQGISLGGYGLRVRTEDIASKVLNRPHSFPDNDQNLENLSILSPDDGRSVSLAIRIDGQQLTLPAGFREWKKGRTPFPVGRLAQFTDEPVAGTFAWASDDTLVVKICGVETPFHVTYTLKFAGDEVTLNSELNAAFGPTRRPTLKGTH